MGVLTWELVYPEVFKYISVYQLILPVSFFRVRRIKHSYIFTNICQSTRPNITEYIPRIPCGVGYFFKNLFSHRQSWNSRCLCTPNFRYQFHKSRRRIALWDKWKYMTWRHLKLCFQIKKKNVFFFLSNDNYVQNLFLPFYFSPTWRFAYFDKYGPNLFAADIWTVMPLDTGAPFKTSFPIGSLYFT